MRVWEDLQKLRPAVRGNSQVWTGGFLPAAETAHQYRLTVTWPMENADERYAREIDMVTLTVDAKQHEPESI